MDQEVPMGLGSFQIRWAETATRFLEKHKVLSFSIFSFFYFLGACGKASSKPFWFDELFSWYVAQLPSLSEIWNALYEGIENHPPLHYFLIHASHGVLGTGELATRLPFIVGFWLALLFVFMFILKRCGSVIAYLSLLFLCLSLSYGYAFEARPYALVLACCSASLLCWQWAIEGRFRRLGLMGLSLSLGVALFSHYYAILLFPPLMMGEAYRSLRSKRVDWSIWISMAVGAAVLLPLVPMMLKHREYSEFFWAKPTRERFLEVINWFFHDPILVYFCIVGFLIGVLKRGHSQAVNKKNRSATWNIPSHELVAMMTLLLLPIIGFVFAKLVTHAFNPRYFLPTLIGIALGLAFLYQRLLQDRVLVTAVLLVSLLSIFIYGQAVDAQGFVSKKIDILGRRLAQSLNATGDQGPIVISDGVKFLEYLHYAPPDLKSRLCYLIDPSAVRQKGVDTVERSLNELRKKVPMCVEDYRSFLSSHDHFYLYSPIDLLLLHLLEDRAQIKFENRGENIFLEVFVDR